MKNILILLVLVTLGVANKAFAQGARAIIDFNTTFSYGSTVKLDIIGNLDLGEVSLGSLSSGDNNATITSQLAYIDPAHLSALKNLPKPIYVDYVLVKFENGRLVPATIEDDNAVRLIFKYGKKLPKPVYSPSIAAEDGRNIGYLDLQYNIFYQMSFEKPGKDISVWQTAETLVDSSNGSVTMKLVNFINENDFAKLKSLPVEAKLESVKSIWSDEKDKFVLSSETPWNWDSRTDKYTIEIVWNADIHTAAASTQDNPATASTNNAGQTNTQFTITATKSGNIVKIEWSTISGATTYKLSLRYPNGGVKTFSDSNNSDNVLELKNLAPGVYGATVEAFGSNGALIYTGTGQITN